jgi:quercetin dioxygenase-like cupin family protein
MADPPRRVVTGHAPDGRSVIVSDGPPPVSRVVADGAAFHELWITAAAPAPIEAAEAEPTERHLVVPPPPSGSVIRIVDFPPGARSPMHRTESVDYGIVLAGQVHLVLDDSETALAPGDVVVQRGTDHAWHNRADAPARMAFVLIDGAFGDDLRALLGDRAGRLMGEPPQD